MYRLNRNRYNKILHKICFSIFMKFLRTEDIELRGYFTFHSKCNISPRNIPVQLFDFFNTYFFCRIFTIFLWTVKVEHIFLTPTARIWRWAISSRLFLSGAHFHKGQILLYRGKNMLFRLINKRCFLLTDLLDDKNRD